MNTFANGGTSVDVDKEPPPSTNLKVSFHGDNSDAEGLVLKPADFNKLEQRVEAAKAKLATISANQKEEMEPSLNFGQNKLIRVFADSHGGKKVTVTGVNGPMVASITLKTDEKIDEFLTFLKQF